MGKNFPVKRNKRHCSEGCQCKNCSNLPCSSQESTQLEEIALEEEIIENRSADGHDDDDKIVELMEWIFGTTELDIDSEEDSQEDRD